MRLFRNIEQLDESLRGGAITIGNFDGVHRGHAHIISTLKRLAAEVNGPAIVFTFDPHPVRLLRPEQAPPPLTWTNRKADLLAELNIDGMIAYPTDHVLLNMTAREFFDRIVVEGLQAKAMVEGPNFFFGKGRSGDVSTLRDFCAEADIRLEIVEPVQSHPSGSPDDNDTAIISSSRVRDAIRKGDVSTAAAMLTRPYRIRGVVTHGAARGKKIGFPTANLDGIDTLTPPLGVYAGRSWVQGRAVPAAIHIGPSPTFGDDQPKVEVHLIGESVNIYGQLLEVDFLTRLRDIHAFNGREELIAQLQIDISDSRREFENYTGEESK